MIENFETLKISERFKKLGELDNIVATTSFGIQSVVMLDLLKKYAPHIPIIFIDTGFLFPETYQYKNKLIDVLDLHINPYQALFTSADIQANNPELWKTDPQNYAQITKILPLEFALKEFNAKVWISGLRQSQSSSRKNKLFIESQGNITKIYPILDWADAQVDFYINDNNLPRHPLEEKGYVTSGDWHSTYPLDEKGKEATRFDGINYECGIHNYQI